MVQRLGLVLLSAVVLLWGCQPANDVKKGAGTTPPTKLEPRAATSATEWVLSPDNTKIEFVGSKAQGKHDGGFKDFTGSFDLPADLAKAKVSVEINTDSLYTDTAKLTQHLKSPDFFNVKSNPRITFASTRIVEDKGEGRTHKITGDLTMLGKTKSISFPADISTTGGVLKMNSSFTIDRTDFGMNYGQGKVNNEVKIKVAVDAKKK